MNWFGESGSFNLLPPARPLGQLRQRPLEALAATNMVISAGRFCEPRDENTHRARMRGATGARAQTSASAELRVVGAKVADNLRRSDWLAGTLICVPEESGAHQLTGSAYSYELKCRCLRVPTAEWLQRGGRGELILIYIYGETVNLVAGQCVGKLEQAESSSRAQWRDHCRAVPVRVVIEAAVVNSIAIIVYRASSAGGRSIVAAAAFCSPSTSSGGRRTRSMRRRVAACS